MSIRKVWDAMRHYPDWDRQMSTILSMIPRYGIETVEIACEMAFEENAVSQSVILNYLTRLSEDPQPASIPVPEKLRLSKDFRADCMIYNALLKGDSCYGKIS